MHPRNQSLSGMSGFSLMEVLIAMLILSIGLLGLAALQATSLKTNQEAYQRTQATFLAYDMIDRIRANRARALTGNYDLAMADDAPTGAAIDDVDVANWLNVYVAVLIPAGDGAIDCTTAAGSCTITVQWDASRTGGAATDSADIMQFAFTSEI